MYSQTCRLWVMHRRRCSPVRVRIEYRQLYTYFIEKGMYLQYVFKQSALCFIACLISSQQQGRATGPPRPIHCCCYPQRKNQGALHQALRIATTEWGLTAQIIISSAYNNNRWCWFQCVAHAPWYMCITQEWYVCEYMFLHKKWSSLHGLSSLSFCRWGPVTPCITTVLYHWW